jgi:hypothetical protein
MWDYRLLKAHYILQEWYRDGIPIWWDESERVNFEVVSRVSKSRAAIERAQDKAGKAKTPVHGRYFVAEPHVLGGGEFPTREEWLEEQAKKRGNDKRRSTKFGSSDSGPSVLRGRK